MHMRITQDPEDSSLIIKNQISTLRENSVLVPQY